MDQKLLNESPYGHAIVKKWALLNPRIRLFITVTSIILLVPLCIMSGVNYTVNNVFEFVTVTVTPEPTRTSQLTATNTSQPAKTNTPSPTRTSIPATQTAIPPSSNFGVDSPKVSDKDSMTLLYVPAGNFQMGNNSYSHQNESPVHTVYLDAFWIDKTEVTNKMYALCVTADICKPPAQTDSFSYSNYYGNPQYDRYPVIYVDWNRAKTYCEWAGRKLPTEVQWEKAASGTDGAYFPWNSISMDCSFANYRDYEKGECMGDTTEVGKYIKGASPYGALDMAGNVWEWVADWYSVTYYASSPASNPVGPALGQYRVLRGGSWDSYNARSAIRSWYNPMYVNYNTGFRCAMDAP